MPRERPSASTRRGARAAASSRSGTTVVRALETVTDDAERRFPAKGGRVWWSQPERPVRSVTGLITGFHEPRATHLMLLEQVERDRGRRRKRRRSNRISLVPTTRRGGRDICGTSSATRI